jgi:hypothetical protein
MKSSMQATAQSRVDGQDAFAHRQHLGRAQRGAQGLDLAVDVGFGDVVEVDQGQPTQPGACQRLRCPGADAADADHRDMGARGADQRTAAVQALDAAEATHMVRRGIHSAILIRR